MDTSTIVIRVVLLGALLFSVFDTVSTIREANQLTAEPSPVVESKNECRHLLRTTQPAIAERFCKDVAAMAAPIRF
ncbi:hypothetical protein PTW32_09765 [Dechloromonas agitata]|uniref:hypothetical protein n=1 Tax=Dechloromonas agitata TaxID=73030 RepID=UPI00237EC835|nr:hypothetical protein [Dechloromonas agitata]MDE1545709.1 hypothetical protein [Dechloromonas agitata]